MKLSSFNCETNLVRLVSSFVATVFLLAFPFGAPSITSLAYLFFSCTLANAFISSDKFFLGEKLQHAVIMGVSGNSMPKSSCLLVAGLISVLSRLLIRFLVASRLSNSFSPTAFTASLVQSGSKPALCTVFIFTISSGEALARSIASPSEAVTIRSADL